MNAWFYQQSFTGGTRASTVTVGEPLACITCDVCGGGTLMKCVECDRPLCKRRECGSVHECQDAGDNDDV